MNALTTLAELLGHGGRAITQERKLPDSVVTHDSVDQMEFGNYTDDSPRFRRIAVEEAPEIPPAVRDPDPIDFTSASGQEIAKWQEQARAAREAREEAPPYGKWDKLTRDLFYSYHTHDSPDIVEPVDPGVELHKRIMPKIMAEDEHAQSRNITRDDPTMAAMATMAAARVLREALQDELSEQARQAEEFEQHRQDALSQRDELQDLREQAREAHEKGQPIPQELRDQIKQAVASKQAAQVAAQQVAANATPMSGAAVEAIASAAEAGQMAAEAAANLPSFGAGFGQGEPVYESPEQALTIAQMWAENPQLRAMAELFGRLDKDIRFQRSKRVVGGNDEIVSVEFGDNLARVLPAELALFADDELEDDFLARYASRELLCFSTVGEEHAGRGPIIIVLDGSYSMEGEPNIWARAISMCLLHIARGEKRDFACIEFSGGTEYDQWLFPAKTALNAEMIIEMASHFFGGGTTPIVGVTAAAKLMANAPEFKKADLVIVGDGEASFGDEDRRLREQLNGMGVRLWGIGIGSSFNYLEEYCEAVVPVREFELTDPSAATAMLATHIT